jgi:hypothetical protein
MPLRERNARGASPESVPGAVGQQAYGYQPISAAEHFIPPELLSPCLSAEARTGTPSALLASASRPRPGSGPRSAGLRKDRRAGFGIREGSPFPSQLGNRKSTTVNQEEAPCLELRLGS